MDDDDDDDYLDQLLVCPIYKAISLYFGLGLYIMYFICPLALCVNFKPAQLNNPFYLNYSALYADN